MLIRKAEFYDYGGIRDLIFEFYNESVEDFIYEIDLDSIYITVNVLIEKYIMIVAIENDKAIGVIAGTIDPADYNHKLQIATEIIWFVTKEHRKGSIGIKLFKEFEKESTKRGATHIAMAFMENLHPDKLKGFYKSQGYTLMQTQYIRSLI